MARITFPHYAVDFPVSMQASAGLAERYLGPDSPFVFAGHNPKVTFRGASVPHVGRRLVEVRPERFVSFLRKYTPTETEEIILCEGLRAWTMCPDKVTRTVHTDSFETSSADFVHASMAIQSLEHFADSLNGARLSQIENNGPHWTGRELAKYWAFDLVDFDVFFLLGGIDEALVSGSVPQFKRDRENQRLPLRCVLAAMHSLHVRLEECATERKKRPWGINRARIEASKLMSAVGIRKGVSPDTIRNHWESLHHSAALIYAAALTDSGLMFAWLLCDNDPYAMDYVARYIPAWFACANAVADQLLRPLGLLNKKWKPLEVQNTSALPRPLQSDRLQILLQLQANAELETLWQLTQRSGTMVTEEDGTRYFDPT